MCSLTHRPDLIPSRNSRVSHIPILKEHCKWQRASNEAIANPRSPRKQRRQLPCLRHPLVPRSRALHSYQQSRNDALALAVCGASLEHHPLQSRMRPPISLRLSSSERIWVLLATRKRAEGVCNVEAASPPDVAGHVAHLVLINHRSAHGPRIAALFSARGAVV